MNYWILTTEYPPLYGGGISTYCYHTAKMLSRNGHNVTIFLPSGDTKNFEIAKKEDIRMVKFNDNRSNMAGVLGHVARMSYEFAEILKLFINAEGKPECIESQEYLAIAYYLLQYKLLNYPEFTGIPVIITIHSPAFLYLTYNREGLYEFPNYWTCEMEISCIQSADWIIAPSDYIISEINKLTSIDENKLSVIPNPFEQQKDEQISTEWIPNKIVFYGKLSPQKGVFELFAYLKELWDKGFPHGVTVVGGTDKVYYPEMKTMGQVIRAKYNVYFKKGLIRFVGKIPPHKFRSTLSDAHVVLIPSLNDNFPYAAIESMSLGKIVLGSMQGGQAEIIRDGKNGFLFDHLVPGSFGVKLKQILMFNQFELKNICQEARVSIENSLKYDVIYNKKIVVIKSLVEKRSDQKSIFPFNRNLEVPFLSQVSPYSKGLLSVVIPFYNMGNFISECVDSVLQSSFDKIEIIIVDDGSDDEASLAVLNEWTTHKKIKILRKMNGGVASARNYGAETAEGEWISFIDPDDKVHPEYYNKAIAVLKQYRNVSFVGCWVQFFGEKNSIWPCWNPEAPYILLHNSINSSSLVYKKEAYLAGGIHDKAVDYGLEDYGSVISMLAHGYRGVALPECLFQYRIRNGSMSGSLTRYKLLHSYQYLSKKHAALYGQFAPELFSLLNANGPAFAYDNPTFPIKVVSRMNGRDGLMVRLKMFVKKKPALKRSLLSIRNFLGAG